VGGGIGTEAPGGTGGSGGGTVGSGGGGGCSRNRRRRGPSIAHPPNPPALVVGNIKCTVRSDGEARRAVRGLPGFFDRAGKSISEDDRRPGGLAVRQWLEHHVVAALGQRRAIPRAVEGDERTALVGSGELTPVIKQEVVGRPMPGKRRDRCSLVGTR